MPCPRCGESLTIHTNPSMLASGVPFCPSFTYRVRVKPEPKIIVPEPGEVAQFTMGGT